MTWSGFIHHDGTSAIMVGGCPWCSGYYTQVFHSGACPRLAEIEYHENGTVKRVRFHPDSEAVRAPRGEET